MQEDRVFNGIIVPIQSDKKMGKEVKADAYITKPFKFDALLGKVNELLKEKK